MRHSVVLGVFVLASTGMSGPTARRPRRAEDAKAVEGWTSVGLLAQLESGRVSFEGSDTVLLVNEMTDIISPKVRIGSAATGRDEQAERRLKTWRLWSGRVEGAPSSWVTFVARAADDIAAVEVDGTVRYADGAELLLSGGNGSTPIDVEAKGPPPLQAEPVLLDHTYTFKSQQPGGRSDEKIDLDAAGQTYTGGRHPELDDDVVTAADGTGKGGDRGRRAVPVTMDNLTACEVFIDADANFVSHMESRPPAVGGARATAQAREQFVLTQLLFAQDLFTRSFGREVHLSFRGYYENGVAIPAAHSSPGPVLTGYQTWLAQGASSTESVTSAVRGSTLPTSQDVCLNLLFTHTAIQGGTAGLATRPAFPSFAGGACWKGLGITGGAYTAINTAYVTTQSTNGPFDDGTIAVTVAHELGHNLGAMHDDLFVESTGCHRDADDERYVMWPSIENTDEVSFSNCSAETVHKLVHNRRASASNNCLNPYGGSSLCAAAECAPTAECMLPATCSLLDGSCYGEEVAPDGYPCNDGAAGSGADPTAYCMSGTCTSYPTGCGQSLLLSFDNTVPYAFEGVFVRASEGYNRHAVFEGHDTQNADNVIIYVDGVNDPGWYIGDKADYRSGRYTALVHLGDAPDAALLEQSSERLNISAIDRCNRQSFGHLCSELDLTFSNTALSAYDGRWLRHADDANNRPQWAHRDDNGWRIRAINPDNIFSGWGLYNGVFQAQFGQAPAPVVWNIYQLGSVVTSPGSRAGTLDIQCVVSDATTKSPTAKPTRMPTTDPTRAPTKSPTANPTRIPTADPTRAPTVSPTVFVCPADCNGIETGAACVDRQCTCPGKYTGADCGQCAPGAHTQDWPDCSPISLRMTVQVADLVGFFPDVTEANAANQQARMGLWLQQELAAQYTADGLGAFQVTTITSDATSITYRVYWPELADTCTDPPTPPPTPYPTGAPTPCRPHACAPELANCQADPTCDGIINRGDPNNEAAGSDASSLYGLLLACDNLNCGLGSLPHCKRQRATLFAATAGLLAAFDAVGRFEIAGLNFTGNSIDLTESPTTPPTPPLDTTADPDLAGAGSKDEPFYQSSLVIVGAVGGLILLIIICCCCRKSESEKRRRTSRTKIKDWERVSKKAKGGQRGGGGGGGSGRHAAHQQVPGARGADQARYPSDFNNPGHAPNSYQPRSPQGQGAATGYYPGNPQQGNTSPHYYPQQQHSPQPRQPRSPRGQGAANGHYQLQGNTSPHFYPR